ncbi:unnamed protein product, partial [Sphenostylis stenocarpa]
ILQMVNGGPIVRAIIEGSHQVPKRLKLVNLTPRKIQSNNNNNNSRSWVKSYFCSNSTTFPQLWIPYEATSHPLFYVLYGME